MTNNRSISYPLYNIKLSREQYDKLFKGKPFKRKKVKKRNTSQPHRTTLSSSRSLSATNSNSRATNGLATQNNNVSAETKQQMEEIDEGLSAVSSLASNLSKNEYLLQLNNQEQDKAAKADLEKLNRLSKNKAHLKPGAFLRMQSNRSQVYSPYTVKENSSETTTNSTLFHRIFD